MIIHICTWGCYERFLKEMTLKAKAQGTEVRVQSVTLTETVVIIITMMSFAIPWNMVNSFHSCFLFAFFLMQLCWIYPFKPLSVAKFYLNILLWPKKWLSFSRSVSSSGIVKMSIAYFKTKRVTKQCANWSPLYFKSCIFMLDMY